MKEATTNNPLSAPAMHAGAVTGTVRNILQVEGFCLLAATVFFYFKLGFDWSDFFMFFLVPDIAFLGFLAGPKIGATTYNLTHSSVGGIFCLMAGNFFSLPWLVAAGIIWLAHVGFDRALGYGLKYSAGFHFTHLGTIGKPKNF